MRTELVMFDFDGTLVDTAPDLISAANIYLKSQGFEGLSEERIRSEIGNGLKRLIVDLYPRSELTLEKEKEIERGFLETYEKEFLKTPRLFEGVREFLEEWPGAIAIVSNKRRRFITPILEQLGLSDFPWVAVIGGDSYPNMKPHPEPFLAAIAAAGTVPEESVIVGDGIPDVEGALNTGLRCIAVEFGYTPIDDLMDRGAHDRLESYHDLMALLRTSR